MKIKKTIATLVAAVAVASTFAVNASASSSGPITLGGTKTYLTTTVGGSSCTATVATPDQAGYRTAKVVSEGNCSAENMSTVNRQYVSVTASRSGYLVTAATGYFNVNGSSASLKA